MLTFAAEGNGQGRLEINGQTAPVTYELIVAREEDESRQVRIKLSAPRDWLLNQGFKGEATLVRANGDRIPVRRDGELDVGDAMSVTLEGYDDTRSDASDVAQAYPELKH
ncbi:MULTISPECIES: hypothetical protein [unclassified Rhizobium]|uniref:hypothetical protein n=1 Tax=unclassified Rhizobium TaxID=2613769 RepID=UPI000715746E|nr:MULTISPECIES: hypothetical protein [unclassified Rhizobium]KQS87201.1 hypothetical protein ASG58_02975 [Rhizobium sp. Leaf383]